ncbi:site-specific DNA-methyltransferase [Rhodococcus sp. 1139]|jgi:DNA modification methylase|uniref:DNA-methyltransferase n=1 Tax=Rhodococcus sp. 1139 TaxID=1833762 RepID=UPI000871E23E|nr:site-specific DNA-methyltransferase [Rhodococcus sp. 1139]OFE08239.1 site-specific DNA-methyltransferase [Rhodococcus sp. 1139]
MTRNRIIVGDVRDKLAALESNSIDTVVSSPPYAGLREYGHPDQIGLEPNVDEWVAELQIVARGIRRVLRPHGTFWLNVGDSYAAHPREGALKKSLLLGPQKLALALAADGWIVRNVVVWAKQNPMPSSVSDRLSNTYEVVLLLARSPRYFFDLDAIRVPAATAKSSPARRASSGYPPINAVPVDRQVDRNKGLDAMKARGIGAHPLGKSPGDVWALPTANYRGAHFATFPAALAERAILAGCPERVCATCDLPWRRALIDNGGRKLRTGPLESQCDCTGQPWRPGVVLDPFMGSGTTAISAERHHRDWLGIELNPDYAKQAHRRIQQHRNLTK